MVDLLNQDDLSFMFKFITLFMKICFSMMVFFPKPNTIKFSFLCLFNCAKALRTPALSHIQSVDLAHKPILKQI